MRAERLMWFGLVAPAATWTLFFIAGFVSTQGQCEVDRSSHLAGWTLPFGALAVLAGVLGEIAAVAAWRQDTKHRVHFMSVIAMTVAPLFTLIALMATIGVIGLGGCWPS